MPTNEYVGLRSEHRTSVFFFDDCSKATALEPRLDLRNHSPDGFEWGYYGSGPAQLALAILAHASGNDSVAERFYEDFKSAVIAPIKTDSFVIELKAVQDWIETRLMLDDSFSVPQS